MHPRRPAQRPAQRLAHLLIAALLSTSPAAAHPGHDEPAPAAPAAAQAAARAHRDALLRRLAGDPTNPVALAQLAEHDLAAARASGRHEDYRAALASIDALLAVLNAQGSAAPDRAPDPTLHAEALARRSSAALGLHLFEAALDDARQAATLAPPGTPSADRALAALADAHLALGHLHEADAVAHRLAERALTLESLARLGVIALERASFADAERHLLDALHAGELLDAPADALAWCHSMLADIARDTGRAEDALAHAADALRLNPAAHHARLVIATVDARSGRAAAAVDTLRALVASHPLSRYRLSLAEALDALGTPGATAEAASIRGDVIAALRAETDAGQLDHARELVEALLALPAPHAPHAANADLAADLAQRELNEVRRDPAAYETAAFALLRAGRSRDARPLAEQALRLSGQHPRTMLRAGLVLASHDDPSRGLALLESALAVPLALPPSEAAQARRRLAEAATPAAARANATP